MGLPSSRVHSGHGQNNRIQEAHAQRPPLGHDEPAPHNLNVKLSPGESPLPRMPGLRSQSSQGPSGTWQKTSSLLDPRYGIHSGPPLGPGRVALASYPTSGRCAILWLHCQKRLL